VVVTNKHKMDERCPRINYGALNRAYILVVVVLNESYRGMGASSAETKQSGQVPRPRGDQRWK